MRIFICWSGSKSKAVAEALAGWLRRAVQAVDPWLSEDLDKGTRWNAEVAARLEESRVGIVCLTRDNLDSTWIHFEAGALSKTKDAYVCTFLLDLTATDVKQPLGQFQHTSGEKDDVRRLLSTINRAVEKSGGKALTENVLDDVFATYWPQLETQLQEIRATPSSRGQTQRSVQEILTEILEIVRNQERRYGAADEAPQKRRHDSPAERLLNRVARLASKEGAGFYMSEHDENSYVKLYFRAGTLSDELRVRLMALADGETVKLEIAERNM